MASRVRALFSQAMAEQREADRAYGGGSGDTFLDAFTSALEVGEIQKSYERKEKIYKDTELDGISASLDALISSTNNVDSLNTAEAQLSLYEKEAGSNAEHRLNALTYKENISNRRKAYTNFGNSINEASELIDKGDFSFKQADYENLPSTYEAVNAKRKAEGLKEHGSIMDYMSSELTRTQRLMEGISPGMVQDPNIEGGFKNAFKYGKANNSDTATFNQLSKHAENLDLAMKALFGDGKITRDEAEAIMVSPDKYEEVKLLASNDAKDQLGTFQGGYRKIDSLLEEVKLTEFDPSDELKEQLQGFGVSDIDWKKFEQGNREGRTAILNKYKDRIYGDMVHQDEKYFNWTGTHLIEREASKPDPGVIDYGDYDDSEQVPTEIPEDEQVSEEPPPPPKEPSPYDDAEEKLTASTKKGVKREGIQIIEQLKELDQEEININDSIVELQKEVDRFEEVKKELSAIMDVFGSPANMSKEQRERYETLEKERSKLQQKVLMPQGTNTQISNLNKKLSKLKDNRDNKKNKLNKYISVS